MDIDFHFYINYILAASAGFSSDDSYIIAYSAQHVDDNRSRYVVYSRDGVDWGYTSCMTQSYCNLRLVSSDYTYLPYHFLPGNYIEGAKLRRDKASHPLCTTPNSTLAQLVLRNALLSRNPYMIGIASHAFADTWAHQNFIGRKSRYNILSRLYNFIAPYIGQNYFPIGHMDAFSNPDKIGKIWKDSRLIHPYVDNNKRFFEAAQALYIAYAKFIYFINRKPISGCEIVSKWVGDVGPVIKKILEIKNRKEMIEEYYYSLSGEVIRAYDKEEWLKAAIDIVPEYKVRNDIRVVGKDVGSTGEISAIPNIIEQYDGHFPKIGVWKESGCRSQLYYGSKIPYSGRHGECRSRWVCDDGGQRCRGSSAIMSGGSGYGGGGAGYNKDIGLLGHNWQDSERWYQFQEAAHEYLCFAHELFL